MEPFVLLNQQYVWNKNESNTENNNLPMAVAPGCSGTALHLLEICSMRNDGFIKGSEAEVKL